MNSRSSAFDRIAPPRPNRRRWYAANPRMACLRSAKTQNHRATSSDA
ncbi:MAG: hypothetical protein HWE24_20240 [Oceanospirillaceae bacterium]|nr:hypothetical protein [Oceanospirillaceae bacterium]